MFPRQQAVALRTEAVFQAHGSHAGTLQGPNQHGNPLGRIGARAAVGNHRQPTATGQQPSDRQDIREDGTVVVNPAARGSDLQAAGPKCIEARLFDQLRTQDIVGTYNTQQAMW